MSVKQVIVMRHDLGMRKGKYAAQASHASLAFLGRRVSKFIGKKTPAKKFEDWFGLIVASIEWFRSSFAKIVCKVNSEEELLEIYNAAIEAKLEVHLITDSGKTEFNGVPTKTCLAIGPDYSKNIDPITGHLPLA